VGPLVVVCVVESVVVPVAVVVEAVAAVAVESTHWNLGEPLLEVATMNANLTRQKHVEERPFPGI
jgi:hypothetical protein